MPVQGNAPPQNLRIAAELIFPETITQNHYGRAAWSAALVSTKTPAEDERTREHLEVVARGQVSCDLARLVAGQREVRFGIGSDAREYGILIAICCVLGVREKGWVTMDVPIPK